MRYRSKTVAAWLALLGGGLGLHRFYLHGPRDILGWLLPLPTLLGLWGVLRMQANGVDDRLSWVLLPLLGLTLAGTMLAAIVYGLTPDERWNARYNAGAARQHETGWLTILAVIAALMVGATVLMATIAFGGQRFFEVQAESAATSPSPLPSR